MDASSSSIGSASDFELPNVATGPNPFSLSAVASDPDVDAIVPLFQRDYHCRNCRKQVQSIADRYDEFRELNTRVVSILPEPLKRVQSWQDTYDLPFPLLADPDTAVGDAYDQPVRFSVLGSIHFTPTHASWLNQIELWFSILQRKVLDHGFFESRQEKAEAMIQFIEHYNENAKPFEWTYSGDPLQIE